MSRKMKGRRDVPVVVMSGLADAPDRADELGVAGLIEKPFDPKTLLNAIGRALDRGAESERPSPQARQFESRRPRLQR
jgi:FixJ family two-component response regulator